MRVKFFVDYELQCMLKVCHNFFYKFTCKVKVEGHQTAVVSSDQKKKAKTLACEKSLEYLSQFCWTLFINGKVKSESKSKDWNEAKILIEKLSSRYSQDRIDLKDVLHVGPI